MPATRPGNTQVYSPFGSFVVEQHGETPHESRHDTLKKRYAGDDFRAERRIAIVWTLVIAGFLVGAVYNRLGRPDIMATTPAEASVKQTTGVSSSPKN